MCPDGREKIVADLSKEKAVIQHYTASKHQTGALMNGVADTDTQGEGSSNEDGERKQNVGATS